MDKNKKPKLSDVKKVLSEKAGSVLELMIQGKTIKDISYILEIKESSVKRFRRNLLKMFGVSSVNELKEKFSIN